MDYGRQYHDPSAYHNYYSPSSSNHNNLQHAYHNSPHHAYASSSSADTGTRPSPPPTPLSATGSGPGPGPAMTMRPPGDPSRGLHDSIGMFTHRPSEASGSRRPASPVEHGGTPPIKRVGGKANVSSACAPCKKAHLACDVMRPCKRCVTMGKEDMCEDVPHKKRGRPKVNRPPGSTPYQRARHSTSNDVSAQYRQPLPPPFPPPPLSGAPPGYGNGYGAPPPPGPGGEYGPPSALPSPAQVRQPTPQAAPVHIDPPDLFTVFTTTDLRVLRATHGSSNLIGYHPNDLANMSFLDWVHPSDRHQLDIERLRLLELPQAGGGGGGGGLASSNRDVHAGIHQRTEQELLSPAEGMKDQYPNRNVRLVRSDQQYTLFNIRLHLGGGLGASLFRPETHDRAYLVVSCLLVPNQHPAPPPLLQTRAPSAATTSSSYGPPTPITPMTVGVGVGVGPPGGLPSFSSIAAGVDAPPQSASMRYGATPYSSRPGTGSLSVLPQHQPYYARPAPNSGSAQSTVYAKPPSPSTQYRAEAQPSSYVPYDYPPPAQNYYGGGGDYRQTQHDNEWKRQSSESSATPSGHHQQHQHQNGSQPHHQSSHHGSSTPSLQTPSSASAAPIDYSRRPWET